MHVYNKKKTKLTIVHDARLDKKQLLQKLASDVHKDLSELEKMIEDSVSTKKK